MQPLTKPEPYNACDVGVLPVDCLNAFRMHLNKNGCLTRDGSGGQHFHVMTPQGWATLSRGRNSQVATPKWMRPIIEAFKDPKTASSMLPQHRALFTSANDANGDRPCSEAAAEPLIAEWADSGSLRLAPADAPVSKNQVRDELNDELARRAGGAGSQSCRALGQVASFVPGSTTRQGQTGTDAQYLQDLRDDFALHSPLWQLNNESLESFAKRRWAYADAMMSARHATPMA